VQRPEQVLQPFKTPFGNKEGVLGQETLYAVKAVEIKESTDQYAVDVKYPEFSGFSNLESQASANSLLKSKIEENIAGFKADVVELSIGDSNLPPSALQMGYEIIYLSEDLASLKISNYSYVAGMAHPNSFYSVFNYDFKNNREISLADFFNSGSGYLGNLSSLCLEELKKIISPDYYNDDFVKMGTEPKTDNFSTFVFDKEKITFIFNVYQIGPYALGPQMVDIFYDKMAEFNNQSELVKLITQ